MCGVKWWCIWLVTLFMGCHERDQVNLADRHVARLNWLLLITSKCLLPQVYLPSSHSTHPSPKVLLPSFSSFGLLVPSPRLIIIHLLYPYFLLPIPNTFPSHTLSSLFPPLQLSSLHNTPFDLQHKMYAYTYNLITKDHWTGLILLTSFTWFTLAPPFINISTTSWWPLWDAHITAEFPSWKDEHVNKDIFRNIPQNNSSLH